MVVKTPHPEGGPDADERFRRSTRLLASVHHPHIAGLVDAGQSGGRPYAVLEFVPGETLAQFLLRHGPLEAEPGAALMGQLLDALACLHAHGIVHRDLSPRNVLVTTTGARPNIKLIDFGLASRIKGPDSRRAPAGGTPGYSAPEQLAGAPPATSGDVYGWGLLFVECLTGRAAIPQLSPGGALRAQMSRQPVSVPKRLRGHPFEALLRGVLAEDPRERTGDARLLHAQLRRGLGPAKDGPPPAGDAAPAPPAYAAGGGLMLCLSLLLAPLDYTSIDPPLLDALQDEQQQWCRREIATHGGTFVGALGDRCCSAALTPVRRGSVAGGAGLRGADGRGGAPQPAARAALWRDAGAARGPARGRGGSAQPRRARAHRRWRAAAARPGGERRRPGQPRRLAQAPQGAPR